MYAFFIRLCKLYMFYLCIELVCGSCACVGLDNVCNLRCLCVNEFLGVWSTQHKCMIMNVCVCVCVCVRACVRVCVCVRLLCWIKDVHFIFITHYMYTLHHLHVHILITRTLQIVDRSSMCNISQMVANYAPGMPLGLLKKVGKYPGTGGLGAEPPAGSRGSALVGVQGGKS